MGRTQGDQLRRIAIAGVGALGSILGGYLTRGGQDVTLICTAWREHADAMKRKGLRIEGVAGEQVIPVRALFIDELSGLQDEIDVLFIATKSNDTERVLKQIRPYLAQHAWIISCQNGINEDVIVPLVGDSNTIGAVTRMGGALWKPGCVTETRAGGIGFVVGELDGEVTPRVQEIATFLSLCRETRITDNIYRERWLKLAENSMFTALAAITGLQLRELHQSEPANRVAVHILIEVVDVAETLGYHMESIAGIGVGLWRAAAHGSLPEIHQSLGASGNKFGTSVGSMLTDLMKGRPTEIDYINGYVVKRGYAAGVPTPVNEIVVSMVRSIESGRARSSPENLDKILALVA